MTGAPGAAPRVVIIRLSALGDAVHGLPVLSALRSAWPGAWIGWVAEPAAAALLSGHPLLDRCHAVPRKWLKHPGAWRGIRKMLAEEGYEVALDLQGLSKSALLACGFSGARRRIGFARPDAREIAPWCYTDAVRVGDGFVHVVDRQLRLLEPLGVTPPSPEGVRFVLPDFVEARAALARRKVSGEWPEGAYAVLSAGGGWPAKLWPVERFVAVARTLAERWRLPSVATWAGPDEHARAVAMAGLSGGAARVAPELSLAELAEALRGAALFVGPDTGPLHIAVAAGTPTVSLYGPTLAARSGAYLGGGERRVTTLSPSATMTVAGRHATIQGVSPVSPVDPLRPPPRGVNHTDGAAMARITADMAARAMETLLEPC